MRALFKAWFRIGYLHLYICFLKLRRSQLIRHNKMLRERSLLLMEQKKELLRQWRDEWM